MATLADILNMRVDDLRQVCDENGLDPRGMNRAEMQQVLIERLANNAGDDAGGGNPPDLAGNPPAGDNPPPGAPPPPADVPLAAALAPNADQIRLQELLLERERIQLERDRTTHERAMQSVGLGGGALVAPRDFNVNGASSQLPVFNESDVESY